MYLSPGVYVEEIPSGSKPIEAVATSTAAFVGAAHRGPVGQAVLIHSLDEYREAFGDIASEDDAMGLAVKAFYMNGGKDAYICRLASEGSQNKAASFSQVGEGTGSQVGEGTGNNKDVLTVEANSVGAWGDHIYIRIVKPDRYALTFDLEVGHREKGKFVRDELFSGLSMDVQDDNYALARVNGNSRYVVLALAPAADPDKSDEQYSDAVLTGGEVNGGVPSGLGAGPWRMTLNINGLGAEQIIIDGTDLSTGGEVAGAIQTAVRNLGTDPAYKNFECTFAGNRFTLKSIKEHAKNKSSASVTVYDGTGNGDLAAQFRLDSKARAKLQGGSLSATTDNLFTNGITPGAMTLKVDIDNRGSRTVKIDGSQLELKGSNKEDGEAVARAIRDAVRAIDPKISSYKDFDCTYEIIGSDGHFVMTSGSSSSPSSSIAVTASDLTAVLQLDEATLVPGRAYQDSTWKVIPKQRLGPLDAGEQLRDGKEISASPQDYSKFFDDTLRKVRDASIIVLPGQTWAKDGSGNAYISEALAHCEAMKNRMVIIDPPEKLELDQASQVDLMALPTSTYAALYYPWVKVANPLYDEDRNPNADRTVLVAPSGFAAGMWAKIDGTRGVWKAPAGVETQLLGMAGPAYTVEEGEQDQLNPLGVNCIRKLPSYGSVIWGSRTLATKAKPEWRYVPVRRTAIFIERSIYDGIQWAVFEPNDHPLWSSLRTNIESFMSGLFRAGAFQGAKESEAFFVRCGLGDTMTQGDIDRGQVIVVVGFAPLKPAEFVIVRIQQKVGQQ